MHGAGPGRSLGPMPTFLAAIPWILMVLALPVVLRRRPRLQDYPAGPGDEPPRISIILPTRNDAVRVGVCLSTLLDSSYPDFEVVVVDHGSTDGTREIVEALRARSPQRLRLLPEGEVPAGRPWRAWACELGAREATGDLLLFTDPGTVHSTALLNRAASALRIEGADLLSVQPRLTMEGFWERLVMPHIRLVLRARFPSARWVNRSRSPRNAVGHHQFFLFRRDAYREIGGHAAMKLGTVEDLAIPQAVVSAGFRHFLIHGDAFLETRLFRTFADFNDDWTGAVPPASRSTVAPWAGVFVPWLVVAVPLFFFVLPPLLLGLALVIPDLSPVLAWAAWTSLLSLLFWLVVYGVHRIRPAYAVAYPVGALTTAVIFVLSILRFAGE